MEVKQLILFIVSAREKSKSIHQRRSYWDVLVAAESESEGLRIGLIALEKQGLIKRKNINDTIISEKEPEIYI